MCDAKSIWNRTVVSKKCLKPKQTLRATKNTWKKKQQQQQQQKNNCKNILCINVKFESCLLSQ